MNAKYNAAVKHSYLQAKVDLDQLYDQLFEVAGTGNAPPTSYKDSLKKASLAITEAVNILDTDLGVDDLEDSTKRLLIEVIKSANNIVRVTILASAKWTITL